MTTDLIAMGEQTGRKTPSVVVSVRDNGVELLQHEIIEKLELVTTNTVNEQQEIEGICGEALRASYLLLRALERVGAQTRPEDELEKIVHGRRVVYQRVPA